MFRKTRLLVEIAIYMPRSFRMKKYFSIAMPKKLELFFSKLPRITLKIKQGGYNSGRQPAESAMKNMRKVLKSCQTFPIVLKTWKKCPRKGSISRIFKKKGRKFPQAYVFASRPINYATQQIGKDQARYFRLIGHHIGHYVYL